ncbi:MAG: four helix bundle protein [Thermoanaerobaculia bacterium]
MKNEEFGIENLERRTAGRDIRERAFAFACGIIRLHQDLSRRGGTGRTLGRQLLRAGTSVGANLEEAAGGESRADFLSKCNIALKESREVHYWLRLLAATGIVASKHIDPLVQESNELVAILTSIVRKGRHNT